MPDVKWWRVLAVGCLLGVCACLYGATKASAPCMTSDRDSARVIISEVAWSGTDADPDHEWIELRNMENRPVDLTGWTLRWRKKRPDTEQEALWTAIPLSGVVAPARADGGLEFRPDDRQAGAWWVFWDAEPRDDYFLLERETDLCVLHVPADQVYEQDLPLDRIAALDDRGELIELIDPFGCVVDTANASDPDRGSWPAGNAWPSASMERVDAPLGDLQETWHTNLGLVRAEMDAWAQLIHGTPKHENSPILAAAVEAQGIEPTAHPMGEPIVLRFDPLPEWPADAHLWRVVVTKPPADEIIEAEWSLVVGDDGDLRLELAIHRLPLDQDIHVWVRTPSGDLLFAPLVLYPY